MKEVCIRITGRVQGIGFRYWAIRTAEKIGGISGWVTNLDDGSVEICMAGCEDALDKMILACQKGPMLARVDRISFQPRKSNGFFPEIEPGVFKRI